MHIKKYWKFIAYSFIVLLIGFSLGNKEPQIVEKEVIKEVHIDNLEDWQRLKAVDDAGFRACQDFTGHTRVLILGLVQGDMEALPTFNESMRDVLDQLTGVAEERTKLLNKLGY